jgi:hypothetical protein
MPIAPSFRRLEAKPLKKPHRTVRRKYIGRLAGTLSSDLENCVERESDSRSEIGASCTSVTGNTRRKLIIG